MSSTLRHCGAALALCLIAGGPASAATGLGLAGQAQLVCRAGIAPSAAAAPGAQIALGQLNEFCNDPDGFDVWIDYPTSLSSASLIVDGKSQNLSKTGTIRVSHASRPGQASLSLALNGSRISGPISLTVRVVPIKATTLALASATP
jgi:hypothetical protein